MVIAHNISAINTYKSLGMSGRGVNKAMEKLSSGYRINKAADDAAGLSISEKMRSQIRGLNQASKNAENGISLIQTAEGALNEVHSILQRMRELAVQSATDTNAVEDRQALQGELEQLINEVDRISETTEFNGIKIFKGENIENDFDVNDMKDDVETAAKGALSSYTFTGGINLSANDNGTFTLNVGDGIKDGAIVKEGGVNKLILDNNNVVSVASKVKYLYDDEGKLVYENVAYGYWNDSVYDSDKRYKPEDTAAFENLLAHTYDSVEDLVNSNKYHYYVQDTSKLITNTAYAIPRDAGTNHFTYTTPSGVTIVFNEEPDTYRPDGKLLNNLWSCDTTLYDELGYEWKAGEVYNNSLLIDDTNNGNFFNVGTNNPATLTIGQSGKHTLSTNATFMNADASMFTFGKKENSYTTEEFKDIVLNKVKTALDAEDFKDNNGNSLNAKVEVDDNGNLSIALLSSSNQNISLDSKQLSLHVGANSNQSIDVELKSIDAKKLKINDITIETRKDANDVITVIDNSIKKVSNERSKYGAIQNRLEYTINNLNTTGENMTASESTIRDVDMAEEMMEYTKSNILQQAAQAMLIQANSRPQQALQLLRV